MADWQTVNHNAAWSATAKRPLSLRQYGAARPDGEFKLHSSGKIEIRTGARVLRLRKNLGALAERWNRFCNTSSDVAMSPRNIKMRSAEHAFDKSANRFVEDLANGKIRSSTDIFMALQNVHAKSRDLYKATNEGFTDKMAMNRFVANVMESLEVLKSVNLERYEKLAPQLEKAVAALARQAEEPLDGMMKAALEGQARAGAINLEAFEFAEELVERLDRAITKAPAPMVDDQGKDVSDILGNDDAYANEKLGWRTETMLDKPDIEGIAETDPDKYAGGEGHVSLMRTRNGKSLAAKVERRSVRGHLDHELNIYRRLYEANNNAAHPNLGKVYGIAMVKFGTKTERAMLMDAVPGQNGLATMLHLRNALDKGEINASEYWGAVQFLSRRLFEVNKFFAGAGIVHNDIKPENFVVDKNTGEPVVVDLGFASLKGQPSLGGTDEFVAPEVHEDEHTASEKSDVFSIAATLVESVERMPRGDQRDIKPYQGLVIHPQGHRTDKYGMPEHRPGFAGAETDYTRFVAKALDPDPKLRPGPVEAQQDPFLADGALSDEEAKAVLVRVLQKAPDESTLSDTERARLERSKVLKDVSWDALEDVFRKLDNNMRRNLTSVQYVPNSTLELGAVAEDLVVKANRSGRALYPANEVKQKLIAAYERLAQMAQQNVQVGHDAGVVFRSEKLLLLYDDAREFLPKNDEPPYRPVRSDLPQIEMLAARTKALLALEKDRQRTEPNAKSDVAQLTTTLERLESLRDSMFASRDGALETKTMLEQEMDGWLEEAQSALTAFDASNPVVKSSLPRARDRDIAQDGALAAEKHARGIAESARETMSQIGKYSEEMRHFADQAQAFLAGPGREGLSRSETTRLREGLTTARRLLSLERDWIAPAAQQSPNPVDDAARARIGKALRDRRSGD